LNGENIALIFIAGMGNIAMAKFCFFEKGEECLEEEDRPEKSIKSFFDLQAKDVEGRIVDFNIYRGKKAILVVNVASKCLFTSANYKGLSEMYDELVDQGFEVLAFPSNQFHHQEPE
jgi:hypothetical protein